MTLNEYARAVARAVRDEYVRQVSRGHEDYAYFRAKNVDLDAIIASVPKPEAQHHDAARTRPMSDDASYRELARIICGEPPDTTTPAKDTDRG